MTFKHRLYELQYCSATFRVTLKVLNWKKQKWVNTYYLKPKKKHSHLLALTTEEIS